MKNLSLKKNKKVVKNKVSTKKKEKVVEVQSKGFTLVELLATISILSVIVSIVIYSATNIINNAKEKSYKTTINNIQTQASSYILEDVAITTWKDGGSTGSFQYQCVSVQNLIDLGYFKGDVLDSYVAKDRQVKSSDYVYLERDMNTKSITKNVYLIDKDYNDGLCSQFNVIGDITFKVDPLGWSKEKDITIKYNLYNISYENINDILKQDGSNSAIRDYYDKYQYSYYFEYGDKTVSDSESEKFSSRSAKVNFSVEENLTINASIIGAGVTATKVISKIDNDAPAITIEPNGSKGNWVTKVQSKVTVTDSQSGVDETTLKYIFSTNPDEEKEELKEKFSNGEDLYFDEKDGIYYLIVFACDMVGNCAKEVSEPFKVDVTSPVLTIGNLTPDEWKNTNYDITISATDTGGSGVGQYYYSRSEDGGAFQLYIEDNQGNSTDGRASFVDTWQMERDEYVKIKVCDNAGNCDEEETRIRIDKTAPTLGITNLYGSGWYNAAAHYKAETGEGPYYEHQLNATDKCRNDLAICANPGKNDGSGIDYYAYKSSSTVDFVRYDWCDGKTSCKASAWVDDRYEVVQMKVCDKAGNCAIEEAEIKIDKTNPTIKIDNDHATTWSTTSYDITISSSDTGSGVNTYWYKRSEDGDTYQYYNCDGSSSCKVDWYADRNEDVSFRVCDIAGNCASKLSRVKIDKTPPSIATAEVRYDSSTGTIRGNSSAWTNKTLWIGNFNATDIGDRGREVSGINRYEYSTDCSTKSGNLNKGQGRGHLYKEHSSDSSNENWDWSYCIRAVDNAGNVGEWSNRYYIKIDKEAPILNSCEMRTFKSTNSSGNPENMRRVRFKITDNLSGLVDYSDNSISVTGLYGHKITRCGTSGVLNKLFKDVPYYYQEFKCSGNSSNILTINPIKVCDKAENCNEYSVSVTYGSENFNYNSSSCTFNKLS